jgi:broad specificity phosphatase PhoE
MKLTYDSCDCQLNMNPWPVPSMLAGRPHRAHQGPPWLDPDIRPRGCYGPRMGELLLIRHGETEWSRAGRHTGRTDVPLTAAGLAAATVLAPAVTSRQVVAAFTSPATRASRTAELVGLVAALADPDLQEWDYGGYEGRTTEEIRQDRPGWYLWRDGVLSGDAEHPGETVQDVAARADAVLRRVRPLLSGGDVALVAHGHFLRVLTARWLDLEPAAGRYFRLDTGTLCTLGTEHERPVITSWNVPRLSFARPGG